MTRHRFDLGPRVRVSFPEEEGRTRQSFTRECDINVIMAKYQKTGAISHFSRHKPRYEFATSLDFQEALEVVREGDRIFADLPSSLRERFSTPGDFLDFVQDPESAEEMLDLGLRDPVTPKETPQAAPGARVSEVPPAGGGDAPSGADDPPVG